MSRRVTATFVDGDPLGDTVKGSTTRARAPGRNATDRR
jgi:hypothetical protein